MIQNLACIGALLGLISLPLSAAAHPSGYGNEHRVGEDRRVIERSANVNIKVRNETLPLRRILKIGQQFEGKKLRSIEVALRPRGRTTRFLLLADGEVIGEAWSGRGDNYVEIRPYQRAKLGRDFKRLQLAIEGKARIRHLSAKFEQKHRHQHRDRRHNRHKHDLVRELDQIWRLNDVYRSNRW